MSDPFLDSALEWGRDRFDAFSRALDRRIDNEVSGDYIPSPERPSNETPQVKTSDDQFGITKDAGTGGRIIKGIPNPVVYGLGALVAGGLIYWAVK